MHDLFRVQAGDVDLYLIGGHLVPAIAGGDTVFGRPPTTASTSDTTSFTAPHQDLLTSILGGGLPSIAKGYLDQVVIPTTMNNAIAMGLGRSGAATEAVANAAFQPGMELLRTLLGLPSMATNRTTLQRTQTGTTPVDALSSILGLAATGIDIFNQFPRSPSPTLSGGDQAFFGDLFPTGDLFGGASFT